MTAYTDISKCELAMQYAPNLTPHAAVNRLMQWLHKSPATMQRLYEAGYSNHQKVLTPRQLSIIYDFLGEP